jgi:hypothetical protein
MLIWISIVLALLPAQHVGSQNLAGLRPGQVVPSISAIGEPGSSCFSRYEAVEEEDEEEDEEQESCAQAPATRRPVPECSCRSRIPIEDPLRLSRLPRSLDRCRSPCTPL